MTQPEGTFWTEGNIAKLKELFDRGMVAKDIAEELGTTRNAVLGRLHRTGMSKERKKKPKPDFGMPTVKAKPLTPSPETFRKTGTEIRISHEGKVTTVTAYDSVATTQVRSDNPCTLLELTEKSCRWPIGNPRDENFRFCNADKIDGKPYCVCHNRLAYVPLRNSH